MAKEKIWYIDKNTECMHEDCREKAWVIVAYEAEDDPKYFGQTHDCCGNHEYGYKGIVKERKKEAKNRG